MRCDNVDDSTRARFADWLVKSPQHTQEYLQLVQLWQDLGELDRQHKIELESLIRLARDEGNVTTLIAQRSSRRERTRRPWPWAAGIAAALAITAGLFRFAGESGEVRETYATSVGEQRSFAIADGSLIRLNTQSEIRVRLTSIERRIDLMQGEAMFDVAHDEERPFIVEDSNIVVRALGTQFNIYRREQGTRVTVIDGKVAVRASDTGGTAVAVVPRVELSPGEQTEARAGSRQLTKSRVDLQRVTAWTTRRLVFRSDALGDVIREFNRYNQAKLRLADAELADLRISGNFNADDPHSLVDVLKRLVDLEVAERPDGMLLLSRPAASAE